MNSQPKWDIYESVVLLNGYLLACKKSEPRAYGLSAAFDNMIRVDKETFVHNDMVSFDVEAIDYAISMYVQNSVVPLADIKSFTSFPYVSMPSVAKMANF